MSEQDRLVTAIPSEREVERRIGDLLRELRLARSLEPPEPPGLAHRRARQGWAVRRAAIAQQERGISLGNFPG